MSAQAVTQAPCARIARLLRRGDARELPFVCLEELLMWVGSGRHESTETFYDILGQAGDDLKLLRRAYLLLDRALFIGGRLFTPAIELDSAPSRETIQQRYRRLVTAFHPDRYPALGEWLTPRSQAVNAAYSAWKENKTRSEDMESEGATEGPAWVRNPKSSKQPVIDWRLEWRRTVLWLCYHLARIEHLPHKIIAATFVLCLVPLFYLYHADESYLELAAKRTSSSTIRSSERKAGQDNDELVPNMSKPLWPILISESADRVAAIAEAAQPAQSVAVAPVQARSKALPRRSGQPAFKTIATNTALSRSAQAIPRAKVAQNAHAVQATAARKTSSVAGGRSPVVTRHDSTPSATVKAPVARTPVLAALAPSQKVDPAPAVVVPATPLASPASHGRSIRQLNADIDAITRTIESYRGSFQRGDLDAFLSHFIPNASENDHAGMGWLRPTYRKLFGNTLSRSLRLDVATISMKDQSAEVRAQYQLALVYADQRSAAASGNMDYTLKRIGNGWKIARISYKVGSK